MSVEEYGGEAILTACTTKRNQQPLRQFRRTADAALIKLNVARKTVFSRKKFNTLNASFPIK